MVASEQNKAVSFTQLLVKNTSIRSGSETTFTWVLDNCFDEYMVASYIFLKTRRFKIWSFLSFLYVLDFVNNLPFENCLHFFGLQVKVRHSIVEFSGEPDLSSLDGHVDVNVPLVNTTGVVGNDILEDRFTSLTFPMFELQHAKPEE